MDGSEGSVQHTKNGEGGESTGRVVDWGHDQEQLRGKSNF